MLYKNSRDKAEDNRSSARVLLIFGVLGIVAVILGVVGVIPFKPGNPYMFYGVMGAVFILFVVMGIVSMKNAVFFAGKAASENTLQEAMTKWCVENLKASEIDNAIGVSAAEQDEELYFKRYEYIKNRLRGQFMNLDEGFLDNFIDEKIFDLVFDK